MRIAVFGTGPFCVPTLAALIESEHDVVAVITRPIDDPGRRRKSVANPVRDVALQAGLPVIEPASCNSAAAIEQLASLNADLYFVCDYGQLLSKACLQTSRFGGINLHGSLLPKYRGAAPINWAIYHGEKIVGATVILMTPRMDAGPCLTTSTIEIADHETAEQVENRLSLAGVAAVMRSIEMLADWDGASAIGAVQDPAIATKAPRLKKSDGQIVWTRQAVQIVNQIRAFQPWPSTYCDWNHGRNPLRLIVHSANVLRIETDAPAGVIVAADKKLLAVQTSHHALAISELQPAGSKRMPVEDFLRGHQLEIGQLMN